MLADSPQSSLSSYCLSQEQYQLSEAFASLECKKADVSTVELGEWVSPFTVSRFSSRFVLTIRRGLAVHSIRLRSCTSRLCYSDCPRSSTDDPSARLICRCARKSRCCQRNVGRFDSGNLDQQSRDTELVSYALFDSHTEYD